MATNDPLKTSNAHARKVRALIQASGQPSGGVVDSIWNWINGVASGVGRFFTHDIPAGFHTVAAALGAVREAYGDYIDALLRVITWLDRQILTRLLRLITANYNRLLGRIVKGERYLERLIYVVSQALLADMIALWKRERRARQRAVAELEADTLQRIKLMHQTIEREAASGYRIDYKQRSGIIIGLLRFAGNRNPLVRRLAGDIAAGLLDLLAIDNPVARLALGFLIKHVIDRLGIDKLAGHLISDLLAPILGNPKPKDIHDVIIDLSQRTTSLESQWATFMQNGGSQVEQAGTEWRNITSLLSGAAIVGFVAAAIVDPSKWADDIQGTIGVAANDVGKAAAHLVRGK